MDTTYEDAWECTLRLIHTLGNALNVDYSNIPLACVNRLDLFRDMDELIVDNVGAGHKFNETIAALMYTRFYTMRRIILHPPNPHSFNIIKGSPGVSHNTMLRFRSLLRNSKSNDASFKKYALKAVSKPMSYMHTGYDAFNSVVCAILHNDTEVVCAYNVCEQNIWKFIEIYPQSTLAMAFANNNKQTNGWFYPIIQRELEALNNRSVFHKTTRAHHPCMDAAPNNDLNWTLPLERQETAWLGEELLNTSTALKDAAEQLK